MDLLQLTALERRIAELLGSPVGLLPEPAEKSRLQDQINPDRLRAFYTALRSGEHCADHCSVRRIRISSKAMTSLLEIRQAIEKLAPKDRAELRDWLDAQDIEESPEFLAALDEGIRSAETNLRVRWKTLSNVSRRGSVGN